MNAQAADLIERIASLSLIPREPRLSPEALALTGIRGGELLRVLSLRNGFYAFESALHFFPAGTKQDVMDLESWNSSPLWRTSYGDLAEGCFFFAEDAFGGQFCIKAGLVQTFDPETGSSEVVAQDLDGFFARLRMEYNVLTGFPVAHAWQRQHGPLRPGKRLLPTTPFVAGGEFTLENLYEGDSVEGMRFRGYFAQKIRHLPDGAKIQFKIVP